MTQDALTAFINNGAFWLVTGLIAYGAKSLTKLTDSVADLNSKLGVILERQGDHAKKIEDHEERLRSVEKEP
jgi:hypothetical protein